MLATDFQKERDGERHGKRASNIAGFAKKTLLTEWPGIVMCKY